MSSVLHDHISSRDFQLKNLVREKHLIMSLTKVELLSTPGSQPCARLLTGAALSMPLCLSHLRCPQYPSMLGAFCRPVHRLHVWEDRSSWRMPQGHSDKGKGMRLLGMLNKEEGDDSAGPNEQEWT